MRLDLSDGLSNHSDFSSDSQNSQMSTSDFITNVTNSVITSTNFITLDGLNSGVPTRTTPTLTPTTLRNIEQTFIELQCESESHQNEAGFVPPLVHSIGNNQYISASDADIHQNKHSNPWPSSLSQSSSDSSRPTPPLTPASNSSDLQSNSGPTTTTRRNMGGRKPNRPSNISPEEEQRRVQRRERNKMAAARCRKRRVDHTNALLNETEILESKKHQLQTEIKHLQSAREDLEMILGNHQGECLLQNASRPLSPQDIKPYIYPQLDRLLENQIKVKTEMLDDVPTTIVDDDMLFAPPAKRLMLNSMAPNMKPNRPSSLNVPTTFGPTHKTSISEAAGIPISTPSTGIPFNFDSLMDGGTGLTPVSAPLVPSCSSQQRNLPAVDLSSPDAGGPPKLVSL